MASGDPPVTGNPVDPSGAFFFLEAQLADGDPDNRLTVKVTDNKRLELTVNPGDGSQATTLILQRQFWKMTIREID